MLLQAAITLSANLYILGDLFEDFWIGADNPDPTHQKAAQLLHDYASKANQPAFILRGNRDFYLNREFAKISACHLLEEPLLIWLDNKPTLLLHGDILCSEDHAYQLYRKWVTARPVQALFMQLPLSIRAGITQRARRYTKKKLIDKPATITDVHQPTVEKMMREANAQTLIHGHTHRQGIHTFQVAQHTMTRIVLGDWYHTDSVLIYRSGQFHLRRVHELLS